MLADKEAQEAQEAMVILEELELEQVSVAVLEVLEAKVAMEQGLEVLEVKVAMEQVLVEQEDLVVLDKVVMELEEQQELVVKVDTVLGELVDKAVMVELELGLEEEDMAALVDLEQEE